MRVSRALALASIALTGACGEFEPPPVNEAAIAKESKPNPFHDQLLALDETDRGLTLRRAVQDNGGSCPRIVSSGYQEEYEGLRMWTLRCEGDRDWAVFLGAAGRVQVRSCADNVTLNLPVCRFEAGR